MSKQTAVQWLEQNLPSLFIDDSGHYRKLFEQANKMFEEQIIEAFDEGKSDGYKTAREWDEMIIFLNAEQYYIETYGKD